MFLSLVLERLEEERRRNDETRRTNDESNPNGRMTNDRNGRGRGVKIAPGVYVGGEEVGPLVRIGLSATARPEELIGRWLAGCDEKGEFRAMEIVRSGQRKRLDLGGGLSVWWGGGAGAYAGGAEGEGGGALAGGDAGGADS